MPLAALSLPSIPIERLASLTDEIQKQRNFTLNGSDIQESRSLGVRWLDTALDVWFFGCFGWFWRDEFRNQKTLNPKRCRVTTLQKQRLGDSLCRSA
jgi:hypothetical protein